MIFHDLPAPSFQPTIVSVSDELIVGETRDLTIDRIYDEVTQERDDKKWSLFSMNNLAIAKIACCICCRGIKETTCA